jgi:preprotein translocase subunit YajC
MILIPAGLINIQINDYVLEASILLIFLLIFFFILKGRRKKQQKNNRYDGEN